MAVLLLTASPPLSRPAELTAILTQIEGQVTIAAEASGRGPEARSVSRAALRQVVRPGEIVHLPAGARATAICSVETLLSLSGPGEWRLDSSACARGLPLPANSYRNLTAFAGRILPRKGGLLLELEARTVDLTAGPILLSPRDSAVRDGRPLLVWTRVPAAVEYDIEIRGDVQTSVQVAAPGLPCGPGSGPWRGLDVCTWEPAGRWPPLAPGQEIRLTLGYRERPGGSLLQVPDKLTIQVLGPEEERGVGESLGRIALLPLDEAARLRLAAGTYADFGLVADALMAYGEALRLEEIPEARVTLGDLYLAIALPALAAREYAGVLAGSSGDAARAAAESGLGQAAYQRKEFKEARGHFERASKAYALLGLQELAEEAREAADRL